jgi:hypothetical protein
MSHCISTAKKSRYVRGYAKAVGVWKTFKKTVVVVVVVKIRVVKTAKGSLMDPSDN